MKKYLLVTIFVTSQLTAAVSIPGQDSTAVATHLDDNEAPLADAGLDQTVSLGRTVELDARASRDPDGTVTSYEWSIRGPDDSVFTPDCPTCPTTAFDANETGRFAITLTVTDDDGATSNDTLYVTVSSGRAPAISLDGPSSAQRGETTTFTVTLTPGSAPLDRVEWFVDGSLAVNRSLGSQTTDQITPVFPDTGRHTVRAVLYDDQGRSVADSTQVQVTPPPQPPVVNGSTGGSPGANGTTGGGDDSTPPLASQYDPGVVGEQVVTGTQPLQADYTISNQPPASVIQNIAWRDAARNRGTGTQTSVSWNPGDHDLFAVVTYTDGSTDIATFDDGTTAVIADPAPKVGLFNIDDQNEVSGDFVASDDYGNLMSVSITVDNRTVFHEEGTRRGTDPTLGRFRTSEFVFDQIEPNQTYTVELTVVDGRGQKSMTTREVTPVGKVEIVSAGFVNGPVDSHHRRLDPSRYTAHHVVEVDLNGNDADDVSIQYAKDSFRVNQLRTSRQVLESNSGSDKVIFDSYWSGRKPNEYAVYYIVQKDSGGLGRQKSESRFVVNPSDPELILTTETHGTEPIGREWGITVDASRSFDPDHTTLEYDWTGGAGALNGQPGVGRFESRRDGNLYVSDQNGGNNSRSWGFLQFFVPDIEEVTRTNEGPFNSTDTVRFHVESEPWAFTKTREEYGVDLEFVTDSSHVKVVSQGQIEVPQTEVPQDSTSDRLQRQVAVLEVPAAALAGGRTPAQISLVNQDNPGRIRTEAKLPTMDIELNVTNVTEYHNLSVESIAYREKLDNATLNESVDDREELQRHLEEGYEITETNRVVTGFSLERLEEVRTSETEQKSFTSKANRRDFLRISSGWVAAGSTNETRNKTTTRYEWRDSKKGNGTHTGETKNETVPAQKRTLNEYKYQVKESRTVEKEVDKKVKVKKTVEKEVKVERCNPMVGCYTDTVTKDVEKTVTETRPVVVDRKESYMATKSYWDRSSHSPSHSRTGETKEVVVQESYNNTLYQFKITEKQTVQNVTYVASKEHVVTVEAWIPARSVEDARRAAKAARQSDVRINGTIKETRWTVSKRGSAVRTVDNYEQVENVVETIVVVSGRAQEKEFTPALGEMKVVDSYDFRNEVRKDGVITVEEAIGQLIENKRKCYREEECNK
ncbi:PKD domain-containing protein [Haloarchaeobius sp. HME9146]|uniref:PKD domain-containing protein n=1 Tax=Haloarchaeobius sp. HME9146 TaxID=2978732 RepID=UPI0021BF7138|nr:PKD domain-containing protein [Haloarchaeobius sp. HME9146]MCT9096404.1 PKD domain-containing protein [Haloarchaeobius sp. HME9146]